MPGLLTAQAERLAKRAIITAGLEVTSLVSALGLFGGDRGRGAIFTLHHVRPRPGRSFQPNDLLEVTPGFLEAAILTLKSEGYEFIRLEDVPARLASPSARPFACLTLDDGYRDNAAFAAEVFTRHRTPFTIFLVSGLFDRSRTMWWETLDAVLNQVDQMRFDFGGAPEILVVATADQKRAAFDRISSHINTQDESTAVAQLDAEAARLDVDPRQIVIDLTMGADEIKAFAANPLVSFGAHTVSHRGIGRLPPEEAGAEIAGCVEAIATLTGKRPKAFAYPYGDGRSFGPREQEIVRRVGIDIAVTTRPGVLKTEMNRDATALPRISLNGLYQKRRYVRALASGIPFRLMA